MLTVSTRDDETGRLVASLPQERRDLAIKLGVQVLTHAESCSRAWGQEEAKAELQRLQDLVTSTRAEAADQIKSSVRTALSVREAGEEGENARLRQEVEKLRRAVDCSHEVANSRCDRLTTQVRDFYEKKLAACQARLEEVCGARQNSTKKGKLGEENLLARLNELFPEADIEDTHATPGRGDFVLRDRGIIVMVEVKNYKRNVQKAEIDKFYRDLDDQANSDFQAGILVSLGSGVCNREDFCFEMRGERPVLFLHRAEDNFDTIRLALNFFRSVLAASNHVDLQGKAIQDTIKSCAASMKRGYTKQRGRLNKFHSEQLALVAEQEARSVELLGALGQKL